MTLLGLSCSTFEWSGSLRVAGTRRAFVCQPRNHYVRRRAKCSLACHHDNLEAEPSDVDCRSNLQRKAIHRTAPGVLRDILRSTTAIVPLQCAGPLVATAQAAALRDPVVNQVFELADLDAKTAGTLAAVLRPVLSISILLFIVRIVLTWYPQIDGSKLPWSIVVVPTEPVLKPTRQVIQPVGGVDVSPIVWVAVLSFLNEILLGPQGILNLLQRKVDL